MKKIMFGLFVAMLTLAGCSKSGDPQAVAKAYWEAAKAGDIEKMIASLVKEQAAILEGADAEAKEKQSSMMESAEFTFGDAEIDGDTAKVKTTIKEEKEGFGPQTLEFDTCLVKEDGAWKIDFKQTSEKMAEVMFKAMGEAMKQGMQNMGEALQEGIENATEAMSPESTEESAQAPAEEAVQEPTEESMEAPAEESVEAPAEEVQQ